MLKRLLLRRFNLVTFGLITGMILGSIATKKILKEKKNQSCVGVLRIDNSEKDLPERIFLELNCSLRQLSKMEIAPLQVLKKDYISQK